MDLDKGLKVLYKDKLLTLSHDVLEGHRFAIQDISAGDNLYSWGMPFGKATGFIQAGSYVCNDGVLESIKGRQLEVSLPDKPNFTDAISPFLLNSEEFLPVQQVKRKTVTHFFEGYDRGKRRGVGTRNYIALLGVSSRAASFVRQLEQHCRSICQPYEGVDGVVAIAHTEGDERGINNKELVLRTLAGFTVHPNIAAVLMVDHGDEAITSKEIREYIDEKDYPVGDVLIDSISLEQRL